MPAAPFHVALVVQGASYMIPAAMQLECPPLDDRPPAAVASYK